MRNIIKRDGTVRPYEPEKIITALGKEGKAVRRIAPVGLRHGRAKREQADGAQHKPQQQHEKTHFTPSFPKTQNNKNKTFHPI